VAGGDTVALEVLWVGTLAIPVAGLRLEPRCGHILQLYSNSATAKS